MKNFVAFPLLILVLSADDFSVDRIINAPIFFSSPSSNWLLSDFYGHSILRIDGQGTIKQEISYGSGQGPGEFENPRYIFEFPKAGTIVVLAKRGVTHVFEGSTGKFLDKPTRFLPFTGAVRWDESHYLMVWAKNVMSKDSKFQFILFNAHGIEVDSWHVPIIEIQKQFVYQTVSGFVLGSDKTLYMGRQEKPEILCYSLKKKTPEIWKIKPPKGYRKPPEKNISQEEILNPTKRQAYFDSYSCITNLFDIDQKYLVVSWRNANQQIPTYDVYRLTDRKLISSDNEVEGLIIGVTKDFVITQLPEDDTLLNEKDRSDFRKYPLTL